MKGNTLVIVLILFVINIKSQTADISYLIKEHKKTSVSIEYVKGNLSDNILKTKVLGSGFTIVYKNKKYAITNLHLFTDSSALIFNLKNKKTDTNFRILLGFNSSVGKAYYQVKDFRYFLDYSIDLIAMECSNSVIWTSDSLIHGPIKNPDSIKFYNKQIGISSFAEDSEIVAGKKICIIGYPLGLGTSFEQNQPITKFGYIAQELNKNNGIFLIDAFVNSGNSGSPVFDINSGKLIGVISSFTNDFVRVFDKYGNSSPIIDKYNNSLMYNAGIGQCIYIKEILKLLK